MFKKSSVRKYEQPPAANASLRAHAFSVTSLDFHDSSPFLASADEGGWVIIWGLVNRRPRAVFKPHDKSIIRIQWISFSNDPRCLLLTHGRDNKLKIFDIPDGEIYTTSIPSQKSDPSLFKVPWIIHSQDVNSLNFCPASFHSSCLAVPNTLSSQRIDVYQIVPDFVRTYFGIDPDNLQVQTESFSEDRQRGIVMALILTDNRLVAGYESGEVAFYDISGGTADPQIHLIRILKFHTQPVLSLCLDEKSNTVVSTSADCCIFKYDLQTGEQIDQLNTKHAGLGAITIRSDGKIVATAGWDGYIRVFDYFTLGYLSAFQANLSGVVSVAFATLSPTSPANDTLVSSELPSRMLNRAKEFHWLATGGKNGLINLYDIY